MIFDFDTVLMLRVKGNKNPDKKSKYGGTGSP
jgi:hypothetical protein